MNDDLGGMQKEAVVICFRELSKNVQEGTEVKVIYRRLMATRLRYKAIHVESVVDGVAVGQVPASSSEYHGFLLSTITLRGLG